MKLHVYISQFAAASLIAMAVAGSVFASDRKTNIPPRKATPWPPKP